MTQARFWFVHPTGGIVRIKLRPGQQASHYFHQTTDEGWRSEYTCFRYDGAKVTAEYGSDGCDCDGRLSNSSQSTCDYVELKAGYFDEREHIVFPAWKHGETSQRDYSAEAMNY